MADRHDRRAARRASGTGGALAVASGDSSAPNELADLVARCLERMESEGSAAIEELCRAHPTRADELRERIDQLRQVGLAGEPGADDALPERLGGFRLLRRLGGGGMGVVYLAEQESLKRRVALKLVRPDLLYFPGARERFRREIEASARLSHPGIVPVFAGGEECGIPYCAMEHVRGASLDEVVEALAGRDPARLTGADLRAAVEEIVRQHTDARGDGGAMTPGEAAARLFQGPWAAACLRLARQVAEALQHAHERGVLHRDVKPGNVMLTPEGRVLLLDFGLAAAQGSARLTGTGSHLGSLAWMAPESVRGGRREPDARTDVYSLGATLHELLALRSPFAAADAEATRRRILEGRPAPLRELNPSVPRDAETVCLTAMDPEPARRYATAADLAADLARVLELRPIAARRPGALQRARRWGRRNPARATAAALAAVLLVGGPLGYGVLQSRAAGREHRLNEDLGLAVEAERQQRARAERNFDRTLGAVDEMLAAVGADDLRDVPQFEETRRGLLEKALAFYRELDAERPGEVAVLSEQARTRRSIADLLAELGRPDEALPVYDQAIGELRELLAAQPDSADLRHSLASCLSARAGLSFDRGGVDEAQRLCEEALAELELLVAAPDVLPGHRRDHASVLTDLGLMARAAGDTERAATLFRQSADEFGALCAADPQSVDYARSRAAALVRQALLLQTGHVDDAQRLFAEAWAVLRDLLARRPHDREVRRSLVECATNYGGLLLSRNDRGAALDVLHAGFDAARSLADDFPQDPDGQKACAAIGLNLVAELGNDGRFDEARPVIREACAQLERLVAAYPDQPEHRYFLGAACCLASGIELGLGATDESGRLADRAIALEREALEALRGHPAVRSQLAAALVQRGEVECLAGDVPHALELIEEGLAVDATSMTGVYKAGETLAVCARAARDSASLPAEMRAELQRRCEERALAVLRQAVEGGFRDVGRLRGASELEVLRGRPEFEELVRAAGG